MYCIVFVSFVSYKNILIGIIYRTSRVSSIIFNLISFKQIVYNNKIKLKKKSCFVQNKKMYINKILIYKI